MDTTNQPSSSTPHENFVSSLRSFPPHHKPIMAALCIVIVILASISTIIANPSLQEKIASLFSHDQSTDAYLSVAAVAPNQVTNDHTPLIVLSFNYPVHIHDVERFITITPSLSGKWVQSADGKTITFKSETFVPARTSVTVRVLGGLPSTSGKKMIADFYTFTFQVAPNESNELFTNNNWAGKFMSFAANQGAHLTVNPQGAKHIGVTVYKADPSLLLDSLIYTKENGSNSWGYGTYIEKPIDTSLLPKIKEFAISENNQDIDFKGDPGLYLFQAFDGDNLLGSVWITLNTIGIHLRQDDQKLLLAAQNIQTGSAESDIQATLYGLDNAPHVLGSTTISSISSYPFVYPARLDLVIAEKGDEVMVIPVGIPNSQADIRMYQNLKDKEIIFVYTDRPVYRKGAKVAYRGIVRYDNDALFTLPAPGTNVRVFLSNSTESAQLKPLAEDGTFSGEFTLPKDTQDQGATLFATLDMDTSKNYSYYQAYFDIVDYTKPEFGLDVGLDKGEYTKGDTIKGTITGKYFDGRPLANQLVSYTIYKRDYYETEKATYNSSFKLNGWGGMCGGGFGFGDEYFGETVETKSITLDANGKAAVDIPTKSIDMVISKEITLLAERTDPNNNKIVSAKNAIVHQGAYNIFFRPGPSEATNGDMIKLLFYAEKLNGEKLVNTQFTFEEFTEVFDQSNKSQKTLIKTGSVTTNDKGIGTITERVQTGDQSSSVNFSVTNKDTFGNSVEARKNIYVRSPNNKPDKFYASYGNNAINQTNLKIISDTSSLKPGLPATLTIDSPADMTAFLAFERGRVYQPEWINLKKGMNTYTFAVHDEYVPSISPTFSFFLNGEYFIEGLSFNVPALGKVITVDVASDKSKYNPGDTAQVTITTKDAAGNPIATSVGVGIIDKAIFALRKSTAQPLHSSFYFFRPRTTNASSSLSWIAKYDFGGRGGGGGGGDAFKKDTDTLYWNPDLKTDANGKLTISVPVGTAQTTWKILTYASTDDTKLGQGDLEFLVAK